MHIEIGDPIYVEVEADDLWCEGKELVHMYYSEISDSLSIYAEACKKELVPGSDSLSRRIRENLTLPCSKMLYKIEFISM